jgi:hypothetical protein
MQNDRGIGCKDCLVTRGVVSEEECIGCNGEKNCNEDYFPTKKKIFTPEEEFEMQKNKCTDITNFGKIKLKEFLKYFRMKNNKETKGYTII